jgi:ABC-type bacteriocin/lantibiotic exporter with double-glycine peptidase domain
VIFLGCAAGCFATLLPRLLLVLPVCGFLAAAVVPYLKPFVYPLRNDRLQDQWEGDVCLQSTVSTCGPASICSILRNLDVTSSEREAAKAAFSYEGGTEAWYLARYVRSKGLVARFYFRETFTPEAGLPAMVGVRVGGMGHFIAVLAVKDGEVSFSDPMGRGMERIPMPEFRRRYKFTGFHMVVTPG